MTVKSNVAKVVWNTFFHIVYYETGGRIFCPTGKLTSLESKEALDCVSRNQKMLIRLLVFSEMHKECDRMFDMQRRATYPRNLRKIVKILWENSWKGKGKIADVHVKSMYLLLCNGNNNKHIRKGRDCSLQLEAWQHFRVSFLDQEEQEGKKVTLPQDSLFCKHRRKRGLCMKKPSRSFDDHLVCDSWHLWHDMCVCTLSLRVSRLQEFTEGVHSCLKQSLLCV